MKKRLSALALLAAMLCPFISVKAENYYLPEKIEDGNILHCFSWPMKYITEELPNIAAAGFGSIQISPLQRPDINEGWTWYTIYLPYDYHVFNSPGMGTKEDLTALCEEAGKYGIKIIVDVVVNHVNKTKPYYNPWFENSARFRTWGFTDEKKGIDYNSRYSVTHDPLGDYVELNTENQDVINRAKAYIEELKACGVKGIRYDAAKHIELPSEVTPGCGTQGLWPAMTGVKDLFHYGEIVGDCSNNGDGPISEYAQYIWVPNNAYSTTGARENGGIPLGFGDNYRNTNAGGHLIYWAESHDDYSNDEWSEKLDQGVIDRAYCALACRNTQAALYYSRPRARGKDNIKIEKGSMAYMGKHIAEVNKFRNAMVGKRDWYENSGNDVASITRENGGAVIIVKEGITHVVAKNGGGYCPVGTYKDRVSGNEFTVTESSIEGYVGPSGVAVLYKDNSKETPALETVTITGSKLYNVAYAGNFSNGYNYIHYWNEYNRNDGKTNTSWPGVKMERAKGSDGKYYWCYTVPDGVTGIIFNNGSALDQNGGMQSGDLPVVSDYIMDNGGATITPVEFTIGTFDAEPVKTAKKVTIEGDYNIASSATNFNYIHYWGNDNDKTTWPGRPMTQVTGDDGNKYWCYRVPKGTTGIVFNDGKNEGEKTGDLSYSGTNVMCESGGTEVLVTFMYNGKELEPEGAVIIEGDYNIAYSGDKENIHYWGGTTETGWPGVKMDEAVGSDGKNYKVAKVSEGTQQVIFNNGEGKEQTDDLVYSGTNVMDDNGATGTRVIFKYVEPELSNVYVYVDGWNNKSNVCCYIYDGDNKNAAWPGKQMSIDEDTGYWIYQVPIGLEKGRVIVSNGTNSSEQYPVKDADGLELRGSSKILHMSNKDWNPYPENSQGGGNGSGEVTEPTSLDVVWPTGKWCYLYDEYNWDAKAWAWISTSNSTNCGNVKDWPGDSMEWLFDQKKFWKATNNSVGMIKFSNNGAWETSNQTFINGATYYSDGHHIGGSDYNKPEQLYMIGTLDENSEWNPESKKLVLNKIDDQGIYVGYNMPINGNSVDNYFSFTDLTGNWTTVNNSANRYCVFDNDRSISVNSPSSLERYNKNYTHHNNHEVCKAWVIANGNYDVIVDLYDMTVTVLAPQSAPKVEALQLVQVQKSTAASGIKNYDYLTYQADSGTAKGVKVNGETITVTENVVVSNDIYLNSDNVLFTNKVLVTTDFAGTAAYNLEAQTASIGKKQTDGKFRGIITIDNLEENSIGSKVNYYYTIKEGVDVKVPMQSPAGYTTIKLAYPEPKLIQSGITVEKSQQRLPFSYQGKNFNAFYSIARRAVEIEPPHVTADFEEIAGRKYNVKVGSANISGTTYQAEIVSPIDFLRGDFTPLDATLHRIDNNIETVGRWDANINKADNIEMTFNAPKITECAATGSIYGVVVVEHDGSLVEHIMEITDLTLDVTTNSNSITVSNANNDQIKDAELEHNLTGDWYLVEFYDKTTEKKLASEIIEGFNGPRSFTVTIDYGAKNYELIDHVNKNRWFNNAKVYVSTLYPFASATRQASAGAPRRAQGSLINSTIVETEAASGDITPTNNVVTGIGIVADDMNSELEYYNLQGVRIANPEMRGVYVVRYPDGTTRKVVR